MYDHIDFRISDLSRVRPLYDALLHAMGYSDISEGDDFIYYYAPRDRERKPFLGLMLEPDHRPSEHRIAFAARTCAGVFARLLRDVLRGRRGQQARDLLPSRWLRAHGQWSRIGRRLARGEPTQRYVDPNSP